MTAEQVEADTSFLVDRDRGQGRIHSSGAWHADRDILAARNTMKEGAHIKTFMQKDWP